MAIELTEGYVDGLAPNAAAIKNAKGLIQKNKLVLLQQTEDGTLLFGECAGSGKSNYACSVDFIQPDKEPTSRCSCPSRQFPCKHALALMYAYVAGQTFTTATIPEDIADKRAKIEKREEKAAAVEADPTLKAVPKKKTVNKNALKKKVQAQLEGLDILEKFTLSLIRNGLSTVDATVIKGIQEHVKQMGNYYLTGAQVELRRLAGLLSPKNNPEANYTYAVEQLTLIHALIRKGRAHLQSKLEDPELALDGESTIEEWLGHAWQLSELEQHQRMIEGAELIQLAFTSYDDSGRMEFVDLGYWLELGTPHIRRTLQYRPYKAAKHIREEDTFTEIACPKPLYVYPGDLNPRVRWESLTTRAVTEQDVQSIHAQAYTSFAEGFKMIKNQLKNPLADPYPTLLLQVSQFYQSEDGQLVIQDAVGQSIGLKDISLPIGTSTGLLPYLPQETLQDVTVLLVFEHQIDTGQLIAQPLSIINGNGIMRLLY